MEMGCTGEGGREFCSGDESEACDWSEQEEEKDDEDDVPLNEEMRKKVEPI